MLFLKSVHDAIRSFGGCNGSLYLFNRGLSKLSGGSVRIIKYQLVAQPVPTQPLLARDHHGDLVIERVAADDPIVATFPRPAEVIAWRFANGGICFAAKKVGRFVGFIWLHEKPYEEDEVRCLFVTEPAAETVWDYDVYLEPEFRFGRTFARLWDAVYNDLRARGVHWTISRISVFNSGSLASHARLGATGIGSAIFVCGGRFQLAVFSQRPYVHLSFGTKSRPRLELWAPSGSR